MLPTPLNKFLLFAAFFFSWKRSDEAKRRQRRAQNKRRRLEIKQIKKNAHEELVQEKKEKTDHRRKTVFCPKKNQEKFHQLWRQTEREKERLLHLQMKNKTKSINSSDSAVAVTNSFLEIPREQKVHVNMDSDSKNLITLWEGKFDRSYTGLAFYQEMLVAVKQFSEGVSQTELS